MKRTEEEYRHRRRSRLLHPHEPRLNKCESSILRWPLSTLFVFLLFALAGIGWASIVYAVWLRLP